MNAPMERFATIPAELRALRQWLGWKMENGRKLPYYVNGVKRHGEQGGPADRAALASFEDALSASGAYTGLGFAMLPNGGLVCVDLDHCISENGAISPAAQALVAAAGETYIELSPSGTGLHIWLSGSFRDEKNKDAGVESFCGQHYLTMTGRVFGDAPSRIAPMTSAFAAALDASLRLRQQTPSSSSGSTRKVEQLLADLSGALPYVDADDRDTWLEACWAVGRATSQSQEGFDMLLTWAAASPAHNPSTDPGHMRREYFEKSREERANPVTIRSLFKKARDNGWRPDRERIFNPDQARVSLDEPLPDPEFIVRSYLPFATVGGLPAEGGARKTTFTLWEGAHIALGRPLFGNEIRKSGAVLFITAEDDKAMFAYRLQRVAAALRLNDADRATLAERIFIEDLSGRMVRLVQADERGNLAKTFVGDVLIETYRDRGLVLINIDPTNVFGPGERYVNDAEAALMVEGLRIARELKCTVRFVHHISKAIAASGDVHQYVGRGGASFADNSRFQHHLVQHSLDDDSKYPLPTLGSSAENEELKRAVEDGRVARLHVTKLSWARRPIEPHWLVVDEGGFGFTWLPVEHMSRADRREMRENETEHRVVEYVRACVAGGQRVSQYQLADVHYSAMGLKRPEARRIVEKLLARRVLELKDLPAEQRRGQRRSYVDVAAQDLI